MNSKILKTSALLLILHNIIFAPTALAVIPPDFIFNIGLQIAQFFSLALIFIGAIFGAFFQFFKTQFLLLKHKKAYTLLSVILVISLAGISAFLYTEYKQNQEYQKWLVESQTQNQEEQTNETSKSSSEKSSSNEEDLTKESFETETSIENIAEEIRPENETEAEQADQSLIITNQELASKINGEDQNYIILDAREDIEHDNGNLPGNLHIRFADLEDGAWTQLDPYTEVYVYCWSGMRGKEVAEFLREKNIQAFYLENGANSWYEEGYTWLGNIKFEEKYPDEKYKKLFTTSEVRSEITKGSLIIDARESYKYQNKHIPDSLSIPLMEIPSKDLESYMSQVPTNSQVITVCDEYVNCFYAKLVGLELEFRGHDMLGRYNKPWEF